MPRAEGPETALLGASVELAAGTATSVRTQAAESAALCRECPPAYPHDDDFQELWKDVFFIEGSFVFATPEKFFIGRNMVVVRSGQSLTVVNSVRLNDDGMRKLDALGKVEHVIRLCAHHGSDDPFYKARYGAQVWALERTKYVKGYAPGAETYFEPDHWLGQDSELPIADAKLIVIETGLETDSAYQSGGPEGTLLLKGPKVLIGGDNLQNMDDWHLPTAKYMDPRMLSTARRLGFLCPCQPGPMWRMSAKQLGGAAAFERQESQLRALLDLPWEHVLPSHGNPKIGGAKEAYSKSLRTADFTTGMRLWALTYEAQLKKHQVLLVLALLAACLLPAIFVLVVFAHQE